MRQVNPLSGEPIGSMNTLDLPAAVFSLVAALGAMVLFLVFVNGFTAPRIARYEQSRAKALADRLNGEAIVKTVVPDADSVSRLGEWVVHERKAPYFCIKKAGATSGYVIQSYGKGYQSLVGVLIAVDPKCAVTRIKVSSSDETPGLGDQTMTEDFTAQFAGKDLDHLKLSTAGEEGLVQAITGATVTSRAVTDDAVQSAVRFLKNTVAGK